MVKRLITLISGVLGAALSAPPLLEAVGVVASAYWAGSTVTRRSSLARKTRRWLRRGTNVETGTRVGIHAWQAPQ